MKTDEIGEMTNKVTLICSNCGWAIAVADKKMLIEAVKDVYGEKHDLVLRDRNLVLGPSPRFFSSDARPGAQGDENHD